MAASKQAFGLSCALTTPFLADGGIDQDRLTTHARNCLSEGCSSVTLFGTTGEGASLGFAERAETIAAFRKAGFDARRSLVGGVASSSLPDAIEQCRQLYEADFKAVLLAPPFYFKNPSDDGLFAWFEQLFNKLGGSARDIILYNIPSVTAVTLSVSLITRFRTAFPGVIAGVKDSSGDWPYTQKLLEAHSDLSILIGDERHLAHGVRLGAEGAISGLANILAPRLLPLATQGVDNPAISKLVDAVLKYPVTPAVKVLVSAKYGDLHWRNARAPLAAIKAADAEQLLGVFSSLFVEKAA